MTRRVLGIAVVLAVLGAAGCGVSSQDRPQPIEKTSIRQPPAPPSVDTEPASTTPTTPSPTPPSRGR
jgi:hypothetical protein